MKEYDIQDMMYNYIIGDFSPTVYATDKVEIAIKNLHKGCVMNWYYREKDIEILYIISGKLEIDGNVYEKGKILRWNAKEIIHFFALEDTEYFVFRFPGSKGDCYLYKYRNFPYKEIDEKLGHYCDEIENLLNRNNAFIDNSMRTNNIDCTELSVIVQGNIDIDYTPHTLKSIRKYYPNATIILSTWKSCNVKGLDYDILVLNDDPGCCDGKGSRWPERQKNNNVNRQIVSTKNGLAKVQTKYALKFRSDLLLLGNEITKYLFDNDIRKKEFGIFKKRIIIGELSTITRAHYQRNGNSYAVPTPFHPSDWFYLGLTEDIRKLFDNIDIIPESEMVDYNCKHPERILENDYLYSWRFDPEQTIFMGCVKKHFPDIEFDDWTDYTDEIEEFSKEVLLNNFKILSLTQHRVVNLKLLSRSFMNNGLYYVQQDLIDRSCYEKYIANLQKGRMSE